MQLCKVELCIYTLPFARAWPCFHPSDCIWMIAARIGVMSVHLAMRVFLALQTQPFNASVQTMTNPRHTWRLTATHTQVSGSGP